MKIPFASGGSIDTDKLNDKDAAIHEAINNLYQVCQKFNVSGFAKVVLKDNEGIGMLHLPNQNDEIRSEEYSKLVASIAEWIHKTSNGRLMVVESEEGQDTDKE